MTVPETWYDAIPFSPAGRFIVSPLNKSHVVIKLFKKVPKITLKVSPNDQDVRITSGCSEMITHSNFESKKKISFYWKAPKSKTGCISFK